MPRAPTMSRWTPMLPRSQRQKTKTGAPLVGANAACASGHDAAHLMTGLRWEGRGRDGGSAKGRRKEVK